MATQPPTPTSPPLTQEPTRMPLTFLDLPIEIRLAIFHQALSPLHSAPNLCLSAPGYRRAPAPLLLTCHQLNAEITDLVENRLVVHVQAVNRTSSPGLGSTAHPVYRLLRAYGIRRAFDNITALTLAWNPSALPGMCGPETCGELLSAMFNAAMYLPRLRVVHIVRVGNLTYTDPDLPSCYCYELESQLESALRMREVVAIWVDVRLRSTRIVERLQSPGRLRPTAPIAYVAF